MKTVELDEQLQHIIRHAWGFDSKEPGFRDHYCTQLDNYHINKLVEMGYFGKPHSMGLVGEGCGIFNLTPEGKALCYEWKRMEEQAACEADAKHANRVKENIWDENFSNVTHWILDNARREDSDWMWIRNSRCKYIELRIDMRDGGFTIRDRHGTRISFDQLKYQYKSGDSDD